MDMGQGTAVSFYLLSDNGETIKYYKINVKNKCECEEGSEPIPYRGMPPRLSFAQQPIKIS